MKDKNKLAISLTALLVGCGVPDGYTPDKHSPLGIAVDTNNYQIDLNTLDSKYLDATECLGFTKEQQLGSIRSFDVRITSLNPSKYAGLYYPEESLIEIPVNKNAFAHELVHHLTKDNRNCETKNKEIECTNIPSYWCGDRIDSRYNNIND